VKPKGSALIAWARVPDEEGALGGAGMQVVNSVAMGGPGLVVVGGSELGGEADAAVWVSTDGYTWALTGQFAG